MSNLLQYTCVDEKNIKIENEKSFDYFARLTTILDGKRCVFINDAKYIEKIDCSVSMIITTVQIHEEILDKIACADNIGFCITTSPRDVYFTFLIGYENSNKKVMYKSIIGDNCTIGKYASVAEYGVIIGENVIVEDFAKIYPNVIIGDNVVIQAGAIVGAQLFNSFYLKDKHTQIPQNGKTIIQNNVLVGSNSVIAQALYDYGETVIGEGTKIDALVSISHNDDIGKNCKICSSACLAGYVSVGDKSEIGVGATIKNAVVIGRDSIVGMGSIVIMDVPDGQSVFGNPARRLR